MNKLKLAVFLSSAIFAGSAFADGRDIAHPNLRDAYQKCNQAIGHLDNAYQHNENRGAFGGHAERAKELLQQAKHEIEEADEFRNAHMRR